MFTMDQKRCEYCRCGLFIVDGRETCTEIACPGNVDSAGPEPPALLAAIREAVIRENLRWEGRPLQAGDVLPYVGAAKVYVSDVWRYVRVGVAALRKVERYRFVDPFGIECPTHKKPPNIPCGFLDGDAVACCFRVIAASTDPGR